MQQITIAGILISDPKESLDKNENLYTDFIIACQNKVEKVTNAPYTYYRCVYKGSTNMKKGAGVCLTGILRAGIAYDKNNEVYVDLFVWVNQMDIIYNG